MSYRQLRKDLIAKLGRTPQRLSQQVREIKRVLPMSAQEATCLLAHQRGLDISRYLDQEQVSRMRQLVSAFPTPAPATRAPAGQTKATPAKARRLAQITIGGNVKLFDPLLPGRVVDEAKLMAGMVYPIMYVFENSVRELIQRVMSRAFGDDWWAARAPKRVRDKVAGRMQGEEAKAWHSKRGAHPIYYTDIDELKGIVASNWEPFAALFSSQSWFDHVVEQMAASRHVIAHSNPISGQDVKRLEVNFTDWESQVGHCVREGLL